ncbi:unnamed protein product [Saccharomyces cerevisiae]|nr:unnamed protein product [Saccharomyces cerevisiae]GMC39373.1 unnamed protein product [Saccharomyces cerevisiae]
MAAEKILTPESQLKKSKAQQKTAEQVAAERAARKALQYSQHLWLTRKREPLFWKETPLTKRNTKLLKETSFKLSVMPRLLVPTTSKLNTSWSSLSESRVLTRSHLSQERFYNC